MAKLKAAARNALPKSAFGMPGERKYPMPDKSHAANAKARASQQVAKGNLSEAAEEKIDAKANRILGKSGKSAARDEAREDSGSSGSKTRSKTSGKRFRGE